MISVIRRFYLAEVGLIIFLAIVSYIMYRALLVGISIMIYTTLVLGGP